MFTDIGLFVFFVLLIIFMTKGMKAFGHIEKPDYNYKK